MRVQLDRMWVRLLKQSIDVELTRKEKLCAIYLPLYVYETSNL